MPRVRGWRHSAKKIKICGSDGLRIWRVVSMAAPVAVFAGCSAVLHVAMSGNDPLQPSRTCAGCITKHRHGSTGREEHEGYLFDRA
jgi:hypothetical protein